MPVPATARFPGPARLTCVVTKASGLAENSYLQSNGGRNAEIIRFMRRLRAQHGGNKRAIDQHYAKERPYTPVSWEIRAKGMLSTCEYPRRFQGSR